MATSDGSEFAQASIDVLRAFVALAEAGDFHSAARQLGVTEATLALRVKWLEGALRGRLIAAAPRVQLTQSGRRCLALARIAIGAYDLMFDEGADPNREGERL